MAQFKVGDVVIGQNFVYDTHKNGVEGTIIDGLRPRLTIHRHTGERNDHNMTYRVQWADGDVFCVAPGYLRKKEPPKKFEHRNMKVSWSECAWMPVHLRPAFATQ